MGLPPIDPTLFELCVRLASPVPDHRTIETVRTASLDERSRLLEFARSHRVLLRIGGILEDGIDTAALPEVYKTHLDHLAQKRKTLAALQEAISMLCGANGIDLAFLKGSGVEDAYGSGYARQANDLDIALPHFDAFWDMLSALSQLRLDLTHLVLRRDPESAQFQGVAELAASVGDDFDGTGAQGAGHLKIDVQVNAHHMHWTSAMPYDEMFATELLEEGSRRVPSPRQAMMFLLSEGLERDVFIVRDLMDFRALAGRLTEEDWLWIGDRLARWGIGPQLSRLRLLDAQGPLSNLPRWHGPRLPDPRLFDNVTWRPVRLAASHDYPFARHRSGALSSARRALLNATLEILYGIVEHARAPRFIGWLGQRIDGRRLCEAGCYMPFLHIGPGPAGDMEWAGVGKASLLATRVGAFLPIPLATVTEAHLRRVERSRERLARREA